ncbi:hypothetical protein HAX54_039620 [Datura stramonium]|uniref:Uncharacterized protein n=1 Tax=Datura stramonium TaxID=4076 RepID=A0ABS8SJ29_DATST|nr:hypothetical protein [Datura stramonium]
MGKQYDRQVNGRQSMRGRGYQQTEREDKGKNINMITQNQWYVLTQVEEVEVNIQYKLKGVNADMARIDHRILREGGEYGKGKLADITTQNNPPKKWGYRVEEEQVIRRKSWEKNNSILNLELFKNQKMENSRVTTEASDNVETTLNGIVMVQEEDENDQGISETEKKEEEVTNEIPTSEATGST